MLRDRTSSRYLKHFMYSFKNTYSENINSSNLMFITGPTKSGKSVFLRQNLNEFAATGKHVSPRLRSFALKAVTHCLLLRSCAAETCSVPL